MSDKITLKNMIFYGFHGVYEFERELGQRFHVDLEIKGDFAEARRTDQLKDAVDYVLLYDKAKHIVENTRYTLLEALNAKIIEEIFAMYSFAKEVTVRVRKPSVHISGALDYVEVELTQSR